MQTNQLSHRSFSLRNSLALGSVLAMALTACTVDPADTAHRVTSADLAALPAGHHLTLDLTQADSYELDGTAGALDLNRIDVRLAGGDRPVLDWLQTASSTVSPEQLTSLASAQLMFTPPDGALDATSEAGTTARIGACTCRRICDFDPETFTFQCYEACSCEWDGDMCDFEPGDCLK